MPQGTDGTFKRAGQAISAAKSPSVQQPKSPVPTPSTAQIRASAPGSSTHATRLLKRTIPTASLQRAKDRFEKFSLSKFPKDTLPPNYVPAARKPVAVPHAVKIQHVKDFQRVRIEQSLHKLHQMAEHDSQKRSKATVNKGVTVAFPTVTIKNVLPSYDEKQKTINLDELMELIAKHARGTQFYAKGDPTLNRLALCAKMEKICGTSEKGPKKG